ncbi:hypothetical protein BDD43_3388 [Mucilaginibacter gracilis]|uniref:Uncharacterized protein n=1 Tax=Mucilaginibacter gracilis TaxID=423350 RepID=A0A495J2H6_9SPHI|nr:hypothetical protein [Mucilaginibacter gracilis]RKR83186.1 hypothetical protein BDD43_3388 [Mucilaginibacter gracilis]
MSLDKDRLKSDLTALLDKTETSTGNENDSKEQYVNDLADSIERYVKGAQIKYINGLTAGSNAVVGTFNGSLQ